MLRPDRPSNAGSLSFTSHRAGRMQRRRANAARLARKKLSQGLMRTPFERLEDRHLLAVAWDGGGDNQNWYDPLNWVGDVVPAATDDVTIEDASSDLVVTIDFNVEVASVNTTEHLQVINSELRTASLVAEELTLVDAVLDPLDSQSYNASINRRLTIAQGLESEVSASQFMILGNLHVAGDLVLLPELTLLAFGSDANLTVDGNVDLTGIDLVAEDGGKISLPGATEYNNASTGNYQDRWISATGPGSEISLAGVTQIVGGGGYDADIRIEATAGGKIDLSSVIQIEDPDSGDQRRREVTISAYDPGSLIDLSALRSIRDRNSDGVSSIFSIIGGRVDTGALEIAVGTNLSFDSAIDSPLASLTSIRGGSLTLNGDSFAAPGLTSADGTSISVSGGSLAAAALLSLQAGSISLGAGGSVDVSQLVNADGTSFTVSGGASLAVPAVARYLAATTGNNQVRRFRATGAGSQLSLPNLLSIEGANHYNGEVQIEALAGGMVDLGSVRSMNDPNRGDTRQRKILISADGTDSEIDLGSLQSLLDRDTNPNSGYNQGEYSILRWLGGGDVVAPLLSHIEGFNLTFDGSGSITTDQLLGVRDSNITVAGADQAFTGLSRADEVNFTISGANVDLSGLQALRLGSLTLGAGGSVDVSSLADIDGASLAASAGAVLSLPSVTDYQHASTANDQHRNWTASGAGSRIEFPNLITITGGSHYNSRHFIKAESGGVIDLESVVVIDDRPDGDTRLRSINVESLGTGSQIVLTALRQFIDRDVNPNSGYNAGLYSRLAATTGGIISADQLVDVSGVEIEYDGTGSHSLSQLERMTNSRLLLSGTNSTLSLLVSADGTDFIISGVNLDLGTLERLSAGSITATGGGSVDAASLRNIDGSSLTVRDGVTISLPNVTHYRVASTANSQTRTWWRRRGGQPFGTPLAGFDFWRHVLRHQSSDSSRRRRHDQSLGVATNPRSNRWGHAATGFSRLRDRSAKPD